MTKKVACRACGFKSKPDEHDKCPKCGGGDWKKVYKPRAAKDEAQASPKKKGKKAASKKGGTRKRRAAAAPNPLLEKRFAILARAVDDTSPHAPDDAFISWDSQTGAIGFCTKPPTVNDLDYLIELPYISEVIFTWLQEKEGQWAFEVIEPQLVRTIEALSYTTAVATGEPQIPGAMIRDAARLAPEGATGPEPVDGWDAQDFDAAHDAYEASDPVAEA